MKTFKVTLCPQCGECPSVEITAEAVTIGEDDNTVTLNHGQWNDLVDRILKGELGRVELRARTRLSKLGRRNMRAGGA